MSTEFERFVEERKRRGLQEAEYLRRIAEPFPGAPLIPERRIPEKRGSSNPNEIPSLDTLFKFMNGLQQFVISVDAAEFEQIFGARMGEHFWDKFQGLYNFDIIRLWASMDTEHRLTLLSYVKKKVYRL